MKISFTIISSIVFIVFLVAGPLQARTGKISGSVLDSETGEALIGANVIIEGFWKNGQVVEMQALRGAATDADGFYFIINLQPEAYVVKAQMIGYASERVTNVRVGSNRTITVNFSLKRAAIEGETVTVMAKREVVKFDVTSSETVVTGKEAANLPVNNIEEVLNLTSGVSINPFDNTIQIRGGGSDQVTAYLDGFSMKDEIFNIPLCTTGL